MAADQSYVRDVWLQGGCGGACFSLMRFWPTHPPWIVDTGHSRALQAFSRHSQRGLCLPIRTQDCQPPMKRCVSCAATNGVMTVLYVIVCYCMLLYVIVCYCMVLYGIVWYCMVFVWYCMVLYGLVWSCMVCMVLHGLVWSCMVLYGVYGVYGMYGMYGMYGVYGM